MASTETEDKRKAQLNQLTHEIIGAAIRVHAHLGPGLLENAYQVFLEHELRLRGFNVNSQVHLPVEYKGVKVKLAYKLDMIVNDSIVIELKACQGTDPLFKAQLLSYLRLTNKELGLLINFHNYRLTDGIVRVINSFPRTTPTFPPPEACS